MTSRKPRPAAPPPLPEPAAKAIPYPPAAIWKDKEQGVRFEFRGNSFVRRGSHVTRVLDTDESTSEAPKLSGN
ncbi:MAG: hypothetical protein QM756_12185 [Polyangiaceae bacterium]